jgi:hypothetical protein
VARVDRRWARWEIPTISLVSGRPGLSASRTCAILLFALLLGAAIGAAAASEAGSPVAKRQTCPPMRPDAGYSGRVERALRAGKDLEAILEGRAES